MPFREASSLSAILEWTVAVVAVAVGIVLFIKAPAFVTGWVFSVPGTTDVALQPAFFPRLAAVLLTLAGLAVALTTPMRTDKVEELKTSSAAYARVMVGVVGISVYVLAIVNLGFVASTIVFIILASAFAGYRNWYVTVPVAIGVAVALLLVFRFGLRVQLPEGFLI
jgi:hypothetical protein